MQGTKYTTSTERKKIMPMLLLYIISFNAVTIKCHVENRNLSLDNEIKINLTKIYDSSDKNYEGVKTPSKDCHKHPNSSHSFSNNVSIIDEFINTINDLSRLIVDCRRNRTEKDIEAALMNALDSLNDDNFTLIDGLEIKPACGNITKRCANVNQNRISKRTARYYNSESFDDRFIEKLKMYAENHIVSLNIPKAARYFGFRSFGLKKFLLPILIGVQVLKSVLFAMFLPSILGSLGKMVGKGLSHISATSSQASYPPLNTDDQDPYANSNKENVLSYDNDMESMYQHNDPGETYYAAANEINEQLTDTGLSRFGPGGARITMIPARTENHFKTPVAHKNYKVFHKIPASSMILSNYDPFYSPLLSRLDGIFSRFGLAPQDTSTSEQSLSDVKLESCREQLICQMYAYPTKYAPYSNLVSAQLSRELTELRRPTSDNPEIIRFFRYMRAARRGQEGDQCIRSTCNLHTDNTPAMLHTYSDINKLVSARQMNR